MFLGETNVFLSQMQHSYLPFQRKMKVREGENRFGEEFFFFLPPPQKESEGCFKSLVYRAQVVTHF